MNLHFSLEFLDDSDYHDWLTEAIDSDPLTDEDLFAGISVFHLYDDDIEQDVDVYCEYEDIDNSTGWGIITGWHSNPYDLYSEDETEDYAYIRTESGGGTYAHLSNIIPNHITRKVDYEQTPASLPELFNPVANPVNGIAVFNYPVVRELQHTARHPELAQASA